MDRKDTDPTPEHLAKISDDIRRGGAAKYHEAAKAKGKLFCRDRLDLLLDPGSLVEDALLANVMAKDLPADGVVTGTGIIDGRVVCVMANDSTVKAGSWGARTVEKILRIQEHAMHLKAPMLYLVDSAGARITDQIQMFPGRRGAGRIFFNQVQLSGVVPQVCLLFGPSAAGGAYIPAFSDVVVMVEGNASMYLGSDRMVKEVIGEVTTLEEMGGARMHCTVSGCGDVLVQSERDAIAWCRRYLSFLPSNFEELPPVEESRPPLAERPIVDMIPANQNKPFDMREVVTALIDEGTWCEIKELYAGELLTGFARMDGRVVGILANQPKVKGGVLFVNSADKAARFIWLCDAFNVPLLFLADVPGFMVGSAVEREGIIRHGAKMISAVSEARVPKLCVILRKAYGAGLYAMAGPAFEPEATIALPTAMIAVMGPEAAVNAVYANQIAKLPENERDPFIQQKREEYRNDIDVYRLASELVVDAIVDPADLRPEIIARLAAAHRRDRSRPAKRHPVTPV
jgi:acetyl-CoA carboxylase carboxyltransferase component